jgi:hypothetical protein
MDKCLCGKDATFTAYVPMPNVYSCLGQVMEPHKVCAKHAKRAKDLGYKIEAL